MSEPIKPDPARQNASQFRKRVLEGLNRAASANGVSFDGRTAVKDGAIVKLQHGEPRRGGS